MRPVYSKTAMTILGEKLEWFSAMKRDPIYKAIRNTASKLEDEDYNKDEALKYAIHKRRFLFEKKLKRYEAPEMETDED